MKFATRSIMITDDDPESIYRITQSIIECYQTAQRSMRMPILRDVERRVDGFDVQLILVFEPAVITRRTGDECVILEFQ